MMGKKGFDFKSGVQLSYKSVLTWRLVQTAVWLVGLTILVSLLIFPSIGILLFWNILIPLAPLLFVLATGVWRNVCPLATTNLLPRHLGLSKGKKLTSMQLGKLNLAAVITLYILVPLRHALFNSNGRATAVLIIFMVVTGIILGFFYEWKSVWCSGLCPVHPVEKLYGGNVMMPVPNAHCGQCMNCVIPCPDSTPNIIPGASRKNFYHQLSGLLITGGLPGFIWGWFHVPDEARVSSFSTFIRVYTWPLAGLLVTLAVYWFLSKIFSLRSERKLVSLFAAAGVSCYYWYRIPSLFGFGDFENDGLLVNLRFTIPGWSIVVLTISTTIFFFYWLVIRKANHISWVIRPPFASGQKDLVHPRSTRSQVTSRRKV
jgi:hypothetical protein